MSEQKKPGRQLQIQIDDDTAQGAYVNMATVTHTPSEFLLDFIFVQPQQPRAKVRARVITSPQHAKRLLNALQENIRNYERRFGAIELAGDDEPPVH